MAKDYKGRTIQVQESKKPVFNRTNDAVSWAWWTWNPVTGCLHGCGYCYARDIAAKFKRHYPAGFTPVFREERLSAPKNMKKPDSVEPESGRVFVCSMGDLFGSWVPHSWIEAVFETISQSPDWEFLLLTKNPERYHEVELPGNVWAGATADTQERSDRAVEALRGLQGPRVRWISYEPLFEGIRADFSDLDWVVVGAQSGVQGAPGFAPAFTWVSYLVDQARRDGCPVYLKPNLLGRTSGQWPGMALPKEMPKEV